MFHHQGKTRTLRHNLQIGALLSLVAGIVNVSGYLAVEVLTTNVTGHFALFSHEVLTRDFASAVIYLIYILAFFIGAFSSGILVEIITRISPRYVYSIPALIEVAVLTVISLLTKQEVIDNTRIIACSLLFTMGLQNSLVTIISKAVVRTTHLTGLFTDLGIELSQLFFYREADQQRSLRASISLRLTIISFFFMGCIAGGVTFYLYGTHSLLLAAAILLISILYDAVRYNVFLQDRKALKEENQLK